MKLAPMILATLGLLAGPSAGQSVLFDFNSPPAQTTLPLDLTVGGITAHFSATGGGYSIRPPYLAGVTPTGFSGYCLFPDSVYGSDLFVSFSVTLTNFSIMYAPQELGCDTSATMRITGYMDGAFVATNTTTAPNPGTWPTGVLNLSVVQGFNSVAIHYESRPPGCQDYGPIFMADNMTVTPLEASLFVPVVVSSSGASGSYFTTELTMANRGTSDATLTFEYAAAFGGGDGQGTDLLAAGRQLVVPDAISYLKSLGIPIPDAGNRGGTLRVLVAGAPLSDIGVTARTTTALPDGRAGLAYSGMPPAARLSGTSYLCGLRQNAGDRSNVAVQNAGGSGTGDVTLRLTVVSGDPAVPSVTTLPDVTLPPGGWTQFSAATGLSFANGYVRVERVGGTAPYSAYGVINDQANSDGSFVPPVAAGTAAPSLLALPVLAETTSFSTELVATNWSSSPRTLLLTYVADALGTPDHSAVFTLPLGPGEQQILPDFVNRMRLAGTAGIGPPGPTFAGPLFASETGGDLTGVVLGARVATIASPGGGGAFGLFFTAEAVEAQTAAAAWLFGLQQTAETRSNLALVNLGQPGDPPDLFDIRLYDGATGANVTTLSGVALAPRAWRQLGAILSANAPGVTQGYAHVVRTSGTSPFLVYGVLNDGAVPGQRTGDGAFVRAVP